MGFMGTQPSPSQALAYEMMMHARMQGGYPPDMMGVRPPPSGGHLGHPVGVGRHGKMVADGAIRAPIIPKKSPSPEGPEEIPPEEALQEFLDEYGEEAKKLQKSMLEAISETEKSLVTIHAWDRSQGLRKCHSRTVVKTRRTRAKIKAFLMGVDPPKEPQKKRRKGKGAKELLMEDEY